MSSRDTDFLQILRDLADDSNRPPVDALRDVWTSIAGDTFAQHTRPVAWHSEDHAHDRTSAPADPSDAAHDTKPPDRLVVTADSAAWLTELSRRRHTLLHRLNNRLPVDIDDLLVTENPRPDLFDSDSPHDQPTAVDDDTNDEPDDLERRLDRLRPHLDADDQRRLDSLPADLQRAFLSAHPAADDE